VRHIVYRGQLKHTLHPYRTIRRMSPPRSTIFPYTTLFRSDLIGTKLSPSSVEYGAIDFVSMVVEGYIKRSPTLKELNDYKIKFRSEEHTSELQSRFDLVCRLLLEKKKRGKKM